jgi:type IV pilus assembly protein PilM
LSGCCGRSQRSSEQATFPKKYTEKPANNCLLDHHIITHIVAAGCLGLCTWSEFLVFGKFFKKTESLLAVDIGSTSVKVVELDLSGERPQLVNLAIAPVQSGALTNHTVQKPELVAEQLGSLLEANNIDDLRVVTALPGPSVFTKRIKMPRSSPSDLAANIQLEAGSFIPHNLEAVRLDYQVMGAFGKNQLEVLVAAVKNEVIDSFIDSIALAGLETAIVDVDYFALQNAFELNYPELLSKTVALINIGQRHSSICICKNKESLFTGDISAGSRSLDDALQNELSLSPEKIEAVKKCLGRASPYEGLPSGVDGRALEALVGGAAEELAVEFNRQLSFFWNASGADDGIEQIFIAGGTARLPGLIESLGIHTGLPCAVLDPLRGLDVGEGFDKDFLAEMAPSVAVAIGLGLRTPGDKALVNDWNEEE